MQVGASGVSRQAQEAHAQAQAQAQARAAIDRHCPNRVAALKGCL